jgi:hypothetical protein
VKKKFERLTSGKAIIFGHSDGDGHLAAEQTRRNLEDDGCDVTSVIVHPMWTRNFRFWEQHFQEADFGDNEHVFVVDIMLASPDVDATWAAVCSRVRKETDRRFYLIDHHKVSMPSTLPRNLHVEIRDTVYECCYGTPSELMLIASICDRDEEPVAGKLTERHRRLARGVTRASTERNVLSGQPLLYLLRNDHWSVFEQLADEPADFHRTFYGNRTSKQPLSPLLQMAYAVRGATN